MANHVETDISTLYDLITGIKLHILHNVINLDKTHTIKKHLLSLMIDNSEQENQYIGNLHLVT